MARRLAGAAGRFAFPWAGAALLGLSACAAGPAPACPAGMRAATVAELFLGRNRAGAPPVGEAEWDAFLASEATPRFPDGLTVLDAAGQWRGADGRVEREASKLLVVVLPGVTAGEARARLDPLAEAYRLRFRQESVLRLLGPGCAGF
ncbi:Hypothetical protein RADP37_01325 [Roseomonas mucosa]|uniref:DUF3574 domain-containing protein n=2 Tax=Roseomonas TaxID=125216 RepID=A0A4Y1MXP2_9PROT|nr:Hypothetical protein RADP37_01325 [Roseomonas mucosa]USQ71187.1 DUF3574 domain-containing protein [Roseomonas mucosa]